MLKIRMYLYLIATAIGRPPVSSRNQHWILARTACMGNDSLKIALGKNKIKIWHIQKCRIDLLKRLISGQDFHFNLIPFRFIERLDIKQCVAMQNNFKFPNAVDPQIILFDSFSELTDQEFEYQGTPFYCSFSDLKKKYQSGDYKIISKGLIPLDNLQEHYRQVFEAFRVKYPNSPILFLHFPTHKEKRSLYRDRAIAIASAVEDLSVKLSYLQSVSIPNEFLMQDFASSAGKSEFPYHYFHGIYEYLAGEINRVLVTG